MIQSSVSRLAVLLVVGLALAVPQTSRAHCDTLDGPVVLAARKALETGNVEIVLPWVTPQDEGVVRQAFAQSVAVRKLSPQAQALADQHFFETVVRLHRAGEGMPYTGLKPAGLDLGPAIPAADRALDTGSLTEVRTLLTTALEKGLHEHFEKAVYARQVAGKSVADGRAYVEAYVKFVHYVEGLHEAAHPAAGSHEHDQAAREPHLH